VPTRVYIEAALASHATVQLPDAVAHHLTSVLRMRTGEPFLIFNGEGGEFDATLDAISKKSVTARVGTFHNANRESPVAITLAQCVSKGERMDYTVQKAAELGATGIVPLSSANSVVKLDAERWEKKLDHWRGVIVSACEQSGRTRVPKLHPVTPIDQWIAQASGCKIILAIGATQSLRTMKRPDGAIALLAGPEGDFSADELRAAREAGFEAIGMGPRILRTETAGIAALAAIQALWGDWEV
jgi:16S rRNA (uracil1498-N3)-methyltransferase